MGAIVMVCIMAVGGTCQWYYTGGIPTRFL